MSKTLLGTAILKYDADGDLQIGTFTPKIEVTREQIKKSEIGNCSNKTIEQVKECAQLFLANFFNKVSEIELRDIENTQLQTQAVYQEYYDDGSLKNVKIEFIYVD